MVRIGEIPIALEGIDIYDMLGLDYCKGKDADDEELVRRARLIQRLCHPDKAWRRPSYFEPIPYSSCAANELKNILENATTKDEDMIGAQMTVNKLRARAKPRKRSWCPFNPATGEIRSIEHCLFISGEPAIQPEEPTDASHSKTEEGSNGSANQSKHGERTNWWDNWWKDNCNSGSTNASDGTHKRKRDGDAGTGQQKKHRNRANADDEPHYTKLSTATLKMLGGDNPRRFAWAQVRSDVTGEWMLVTAGLSSNGLRIHKVSKNIKGKRMEYEYNKPSITTFEKVMRQEHRLLGRFFEKGYSLKRYRLVDFAETLL